MFSFCRFNSIREGLIFIAVLSFILIITLLYEYRRDRLVRRQRKLKRFVLGMEMSIKD